MNKYDAIWLTGQPASGKTTLANLLLAELSLKSERTYFNIDGDDLRNLFQNKDYSRKGREANIRLGMSIAAYLINKKGPYKGFPFRSFTYNDGFIGGFSDHLPVYVHLIKEVN